MTAILSATDFALAAGVVERVARRHLAKESYRGHHLPVVALDGERGGASGKVWGRALNAATPELQALFNLPETPPSTDVESSFKARPDE